MRRIHIVTAALPAALLLLPAEPQAHPHVFVDALFSLADPASPTVAVRVTWRFDEVYTEFVRSDFDEDGDGTLSDSEIGQIADMFFLDLPDYGWFTRLAINDDWFEDFTVTDEQVAMHDGRLIASFVVRIETPWTAVETLELIPFDDEYFIAYAVPGVAPDVFGGDLACDRQAYVLDSWYAGPVDVDGLRCLAPSAVIAG
ncbi:MAG: DUF1007 family protein [Azospirillaceae bacterium]